MTHRSNIENVTQTSIALDCVHSVMGSIHGVQVHVLLMAKAIHDLCCATCPRNPESLNGRRVGKYASTGGERAEEARRTSTEHVPHNVRHYEQEVTSTINVAVEMNPAGPGRRLQSSMAEFDGSMGGGMWLQGQAQSDRGITSRFGWCTGNELKSGLDACTKLSPERFGSTHTQHRRRLATTSQGTGSAEPDSQRTTETETKRLHSWTAAA